MSALRIEIPEQLEFLAEPARYKVMHGGRGGAKSWNVARVLLAIGRTRPIRVLCARELQKSIDSSVHSLLSDQVNGMGLSGFYDVQARKIVGANGTTFDYEGLRHNADGLKSYEGVDYCWVEEAQSVSKASWDILIPTIRKLGSEIWITFNPRLATDETYQRFVVNPPPNAIVRQINWRDNPWFNQVLEDERALLQASDEDAYLNVWEGKPQMTLAGAIYAKEIRASTEEGRITRVPVDISKPVMTFWDLGRADMTSIWFVQLVGFEYRIVDFYENCGYPLAHYIKKLREKPYAYGDCYLPHDAMNQLLASDRTIYKQMVDAGFSAKVVPKASIASGIDAVRTIFNRCWFDEGRCADGLNALKNYRFDVDPDTKQYSMNPLHDEHSHAADAFRYFASGVTEKPKRKRDDDGQRGAGGWMS